MVAPNQPSDPPDAPEGAGRHPAFDEEKANLQETIDLAKTEARRLRQLRFDPKIHGTEDAIIIEEWKRYGRQLEAVLDRPYFGRIDILDPEHPGDPANNGLQKLYIGTTPVYSDHTRLHNRVTDWRAPVARLFYEGEVGPQAFKVEDDWVQVELYLVRHLDVEKAALRGVYDQQVHPKYPLGAVAPAEGQELLADDYLRSLLKTAAGSHLHDIVRSIQREQHAIIAEEHDHTVIVQGVAGSGKTSIALHRVAQVLYNLRLMGVKRPSALVVAPTPLFLSYIAEVLPSLFEEGVPQTTFEDWACGLVFGQDRKAWPALRLGAPERSEDVARVRFKESLTFRRLLDEGLKRLEESLVPDHDVLIGQARIPAAQIRGWIQGRADRPLMVRTQRAIQLLRTWLKNRGYDGDPAVAAWADRMVERWRPRATLDVYRDILLDPDRGVDRWLGQGMTRPFKAHAQRMKEAGAVEAADLAGLVYVWTRLYGIPDTVRWDHIVVDEGQDFAPLRYAVLALFARHDSLTIVGDLGQRAREELGLSGWDELIGPVFPKNTCRLHELHRSYRTTQRIIQTAHQALIRRGHGNRGARFPHPRRPGALPAGRLSHGDGRGRDRMAAADKGAGILQHGGHHQDRCRGGRPVADPAGARRYRRPGALPGGSLRGWHRGFAGGSGPRPGV